MLKQRQIFKIMDPLLVTFLILFVIIAVIYPSYMASSINYFPAKIWISLAGLIIITKAIEKSGMFYRISEKMLIRLKDERILAIFLSFLSAALATFLTNDISLFIVVPLTMSIQKTIKNDIMKMVVFEAIGANVGSTLTPIGNPQNLYIWHVWGVSFLQFLAKMIVPTLISLILLMVFLLIVFPKRKIGVGSMREYNINKLQFVFSLILLAIFVFFMEFGWNYYGFIIVAVFYTLFSWRIFMDVDWLLLMTFALIFLDFGALPSILHVTSLPSNSAGVFLVSSFTSQLISNVPAAVFLSYSSHNYPAIAWGVNVGGNGILIASIANIIAIRLSGRKGIMYIFHKYSIPYFLITVAIIYLIFLI